MMMNLLLGINSFAYIFLKAFQQKNVMHDKYWWMVPCSLAMGCAEVFVIVVVATSSATIVSGLSIGLGGGIGCIVACLAHKRIDTWWTKRSQ